MARQTEGNETWKTLREWIKGSAAAERLAGLILKADGFSSIDPSHPLGGPDGIKDILCFKDGMRWVAGAYFPRGQKPFSEIKDKFLSDSKGKDQNSVDAFAFVSNQELTLSEREGLRSELNFPVEIYHLERLSLLLNSPALYGVRLEFLDIEMTKEEQLAFIADRDRAIRDIQAGIARIEAQVDTSSKAQTVSPQFKSPISGFGFLAGRKLVNCKHCGYGFRISTSYRLISASALLGKATIACPSCGHIEEAENYEEGIFSVRFLPAKHSVSHCRYGSSRISKSALRTSRCRRWDARLCSLPKASPASDLGRSRDAWSLAGAPARECCVLVARGLQLVHG